jgi:hypothetical protein
MDEFQVPGELPSVIVWACGSGRFRMDVHWVVLDAMWMSVSR